MKKLLLFFAAILCASCARQENAPTQGDLAIILSPTFAALAEQKQSRATATAFEEGDQIGLYATLGGQQLIAQGNHINNEKFTVASGGVLCATPAVYYPDSKASVELCAYYPYNASTSDATKLEFEVSEDQKASDLCYARSQALPSSEAQALHFTHKLSRAVFQIALPSNTTLVKATLLNTQSRVALNLADGSLTSGSTFKNITLYNNSEVIVPAQIFRQGARVLELEVTRNSITEMYAYQAEQEIALEEGAITTFTLKLNDNHTASLSNIKVDPWLTGTTSGEIAQGVKNSFTAHWLLPCPAYKSIASVKLTVYNHLTKTRADYPCTTFDVVTDQGPNLFSFSFSFEPSASVLLAYPYRIDTVKFYNSASALVEECPSLVSANIYKSGAYTLGIKQDNILAIASGTIVDWGELDMTGNIEGGGVNNSFRLQMIDATYAYQSISSVALMIDGKRYTFKGLSLLDGSTQFLATSSTFGFPDFSGQIPASYPYTISSVELYNSSDHLLESKLATIEIGRGGLVSLQCYRGGVIAIGGTATSWGDESGSGVIIGTGTKNKFTLSLLDTSYPLSAVKSVRFVSGDKEYLFNGITLAAGSNEFLATTSNFATPTIKGTFPSRYPYVITSVDVLDASGLVLQSSVGSVEVYDTRDVALRIYKNNLAMNYGSSVGDWASDASTGDVNFGGALASNPVTLYYSDSKATNALSCTSATKMSLTIGGKVVSLPIEMVGNGSSASIKTAVNISGATPAANLPARYPYSITKIKLENASNASLIEQTFATPIEVGGSGAVTLRVAR